MQGESAERNTVVPNGTVAEADPAAAEVVTLEYGELQRLAADTGRSVSHLSRFLSGARPSRQLEDVVRKRYGVPSAQLRVARRRHAPKAG